MRQSEHRPRSRDAGDPAGVNLVTRNGQLCRDMNRPDSIGDFLGLKGGFYFEQSQPNRFNRIALDPVGVDNAPPKHLVPSADSKHPSARAPVADDEVLPAGYAQPFQIGDSMLGPRNDQNVKAWRRFWIAQVMNSDIRFVLER